MTKFTGFVHDLRPWRLDHLGKPNSPWKKKKKWAVLSTNWIALKKNLNKYV